jgi:hypothetical protein
MAGNLRVAAIQAAVPDFGPIEADAIDMVARIGAYVDCMGWTRPYFQRGGSAAHLSFAVFSCASEVPEISASRFRTVGLPGDVAVWRVERAESPDAWDGLAGGIIGRLPQEADPLAHARVWATKFCWRVQGTVPDPETLDYLRDTVGVVAAMSESMADTIVLDLQSHRWLRGRDFLDHIFQPLNPPILEHVTMMVSEDGPSPGKWWYHTRGMRKFGRPDVSLRDVNDGYRAGAVELMRRLVMWMAEGARVHEGLRIRMRGVPDEMRCRLGGSDADPDFNNEHVELRFELGGAAADQAAELPPNDHFDDPNQLYYSTTLALGG